MRMLLEQRFPIRMLVVVYHDHPSKKRDTRFDPDPMMVRSLISFVDRHSSWHCPCHRGPPKSPTM
jgi:ferredoxin-thioredoxin reductase catalytic subunit